MEAILTGRNGVHVVALVDEASKNESECATTPNQQMVVDHAVVPLLTLRNVKLDPVLVRISNHYTCTNTKQAFLYMSFSRVLSKR